MNSFFSFKFPTECEKLSGGKKFWIKLKRNILTKIKNSLINEKWSVYTVKVIQHLWFQNRKKMIDFFFTHWSMDINYWSQPTKKKKKNKLRNIVNLYIKVFISLGFISYTRRHFPILPLFFWLLLLLFNIDSKQQKSNLKITNIIFDIDWLIFFPKPKHT